MDLEQYTSDQKKKKTILIVLKLKQLFLDISGNKKLFHKYSCGIYIFSLQNGIFQWSLNLDWVTSVLYILAIVSFKTSFFNFVVKSAFQTFYLLPNVLHQKVKLWRVYEKFLTRPRKEWYWPIEYTCYSIYLSKHSKYLQYYFLSCFNLWKKKSSKNAKESSFLS